MLAAATDFDVGWVSSPFESSGPPAGARAHSVAVARRVRLAAARRPWRRRWRIRGIAT
jgi:hypothetical protein